jgi:hypothetical protein
VLVITALAMAAMVLFAAFTIDVGTWFQDERHLQLQADAGALAGADEFLQHPTICPGNITTEADNYSHPTAQVGSSDPVPESPVGNKDGDNSITATTTVACPGSGSYVDVKMANVSPRSFFSLLTPSQITAHARVRLLQVSEAGGHGVLPYAITESEAQSCCNKLVQIEVNTHEEPAVPSQSLVCNGSMTKSSTESGPLMNELQRKGCPTTQISRSGTCATTEPPSCLAEFNKVTEGEFDTGLISRFENGGNKNEKECKNVNGAPVSTDYGALPSGLPYQLPTLHADDPRVITIFVVPNGSFKYETTSEVNKIRVVGYAAFYMAGWDHDPCLVQKTVSSKCPTSPTSPPPPPGTACDPVHPTSKTEHGAVWGYYIKRVIPNGEATGTQPCTPKENEAATDICVSVLAE